MICILAGESVHNTQLKSRKLKAKMLLTCCHLLGSCCFAYPLVTTCNFKDVSYFSYEMAQQFNTCPWRAPNKLFLQEATRPFTRTCTRPAAHKSCCRMACDCLSGGECPPPAKRTTPTRHLRNDTFRNGKPSILHRVNVRVNVCYLKVILILNNGNIHPNIHPTSNASFSILKRIISRKACQICAWGEQLPYTGRRDNKPYSAAATGRRGAGACPGERARGPRQA